MGRALSLPVWRKQARRAAANEPVHLCFVIVDRL